MTFDVKYTHRAQPDSSFVNRAWFDKTRDRLTLELHGVVYEYSNVPLYVYQNLVEADSAGTYYRTDIQGRYRGNRLGPVSNLREVRVDSGVVVQEKKDPVVLHNGYQPLPVQPQKKFSLAQNNDKFLKKLDYTLHFVLEDHDSVSDERSHTLQATSLDDAIEQFLDLVGKLNQTVTLKGASVRFE